MLVPCVFGAGLALRVRRWFYLTSWVALCRVMWCGASVSGLRGLVCGLAGARYAACHG